MYILMYVIYIIISYVKTYVCIYIYIYMYNTAWKKETKTSLYNCSNAWIIFKNLPRKTLSFDVYPDSNSSQMWEKTFPGISVDLWPLGTYLFVFINLPIVPAAISMMPLLLVACIIFKFCVGEFQFLAHPHERTPKLTA